MVLLMDHSPDEISSAENVARLKELEATYQELARLLDESERALKEMEWEDDDDEKAEREKRN
jgi:hypothetical protein